jgi:hypothetical protein
MALGGRSVLVGDCSCTNGAKLEMSVKDSPHRQQTRHKHPGPDRAYFSRPSRVYPLITSCALTI